MAAGGGLDAAQLFVSLGRAAQFEPAFSRGETVAVFRVEGMDARGCSWRQACQGRSRPRALSRPARAHWTSSSIWKSNMPAQMKSAPF